ncbi:M3 family oligoendopeptidase [Pollutibacter soli]|uniref:M3 family oligoendopeptidase n=1 Tax=Pollutibacter soli TaxID=3034157 RepID=UPI0030132892
MKYSADIKKIKRHFLPENFAVTDWETLEPYFKDLSDRKINSKADLEQWLKDISEVEAVISEDACWRQIRMTCDTENKEFESAFNFFYTQIQPKIQPFADLLNRKLIDSPFTGQLDQKKYFTYLRSVKKNIELFRDANIPLQSELSVLQQQYGAISGKMTVEIDGREYTMQQATRFLEQPDRSVREKVYYKIAERRLQDKDQLNDLFTRLLSLRQQVAVNAGFSNYRDYKFVEMGRFDYTPADCYLFHESVRKEVLPLVNEIYAYKKKKLSIDDLRPWDLDAEPEGIQPLKPFVSGEELLEKTIACFEKLDPFFAGCLKKMNQLKHLDLTSRKGKAPGGYNMPLSESGAPFIFMNASGQMSDVTTMVHEGGHAVHSFLAHHLELTSFKEYPTEMAEVASMAMELFSMDYWDVFFDNEEELRRAKRHQLERVITIFPWIAIVDKFQHWLYENPGHTIEERTANWVRIQNEFSSEMVDFTGLDKFRQISWQRQLHLFEVPFYYIEYGIAQLGAIGMWKQFREDKAKALSNYTHALNLGGTKTLPELYAAAGLSFDFSPERINDLITFVRNELNKY